MAQDRQHADQPAFHPTTTSVAATFLDILFGVLLGVIVFEYPIKWFHDRASGQLALLNLLYFAIFLKFFFHWWGIHHDIAVFERFLRSRPGLSNYLAGMLVAFVYFACIRLLVAWFEEPRTSQWALNAFFVVLGLFKICDTVPNLTAVRSLVKNWLATARLASDQKHRIKHWYCSEQPRIICWFFLSVPFLLAAPRVRAEFQIFIALTFVIVEGAVEATLFTRRRGLWLELNGENQL